MMQNDTIQILIVDDEAAGRGILSKLLPEVTKLPFEIIEASNVVDGLRIIGENKINLLFLDVQMPEQNGFDLLRQLDKIDFETIFVTGYDKYAVHAFKFNALDYLLKPVEIEDLKRAVNKAVARIKDKKNNIEGIAQLLPNLEHLTFDKKLAIHVKGKVVFIPLSGISHIIASSNYSEIVMADKEKFITPRVLKEFEFYFKNISFFVRINRAAILNTKYIKSYSKDFPCIVEMQNGFCCEVSRRKKSEVLGIFENR